MKRLVLLPCALVLCTSTASADVIADWNLRTLQSATVAGARRGPSAVIDFATVHLAMHDAVQAFERRYEPYCVAIRNATGSPVAAASQAAHDVLVALFPSQQATIDAAQATFNANYINQGLMIANDPGEAAGRAAAACILERRLADDTANRATPDSWLGRIGPGEWRPTVPPATNGDPVPMAADFLARTEPFGMKAIEQFRAANPPPHLTSGAYAKAYNEVKEKGASDATGHTRTPEETAVARFFSDAPANYWNRLMRDFVVARSLNLGDSARMFALVSMATADAIISCWDTKIAYNMWRPVTAVREGENDGNPDTVGNPAWTSFFNAPNYPDYTSGANNVSAATTTVFQHLFGDQVAFTLFSNAAGAVPREYSRFSDVARDVVDARIFMGIHFRFADTAALRQGTHVANWTVSHYLRPIRGAR